MKFTVLTFCDETFKLMAEITGNNHRDYCHKHGYFCKKRIFPAFKGNGYERLCYAAKINAEIILQELYLGKENDYLFTIGSDAIITNMEIKLEDIAGEYKDFNIIVGSDSGGINSSQQLIKITPRSRKYYMEMVAWIEKGGEHDQRYMHENPKEFMIETHQNLMNSYDCETRQEPPETPGNWKTGDFLVHLAGMTLEQRMAVLNKWMERVR